MPADGPPRTASAIPRIDARRLEEAIRSFGRIGALLGGGVCRLALSDADKAARDELTHRMTMLGLVVDIDAIGNIFGTRPARAPDGAAGTVMIGSHIDTVSTGGLYDGTFGVLAGLEIVAALNDAAIETERPITVAAFTNEEGSRFQPDMLGSLVFAGGLPLADALATRDADGAVLGDELRRIGYAGDATGPENIAAYFELHIEQGPVLEREGIQIGVVSGIQGISWHAFRLTGRSAHAGTTPRAMRRDAGMAAARIVHGAYEMGARMGADQLVTCGSLRFTPGLVNVVPQEANLTIDLRNPDDDALRDAETALLAIARTAAAEADVQLEHRSLARFAPVSFDPALVAEVERVATGLGHTTRRMHSGAGHDAQMLARIAPSAMIFVPSTGGVSHNVEEYTAPDDLARGTEILNHLVLHWSCPSLDGAQNGVRA
ncbi:M20 family metallo-hydrolase [Gluconacetobacter tumulicola]|uniref:M20 family metallo-hydrolase n=1 Tax=Gluconacetobacter tumulicola TaxID=1017177 RepID=A0A7W4P5U9_9PROT|nr:M20 family metallo-hydrolase [Gluconacetobacter tumulicola]MBB2178751.1 M20 family metallo-hydrolase [Gluconacetobacter tumulicola]